MTTLLRHMATGQYFQSLDHWTFDRDEAFNFGLIARAIKFARKAHLPGMELILSRDDSEQAAASSFERFLFGLEPAKG